LTFLLFQPLPFPSSLTVFIDFPPHPYPHPPLPQVEREKDADGQVAALQARYERISAELEDVAIRAEVLAAKGAMYDDLRAKCDRLEDENQQLSATRAALKQAQVRNI
jgi:hypothetical protein